MRSTNTEHHCKLCNALLAKQDQGELYIRRGALEVKVRGVFSVTVGCYRCRAWNELGVKSPRPEPTGSGPASCPSAA